MLETLGLFLSLSALTALPVGGGVARPLTTISGLFSQVDPAAREWAGLGIGGVLAGAMLLLYREALKSFRDALTSLQTAHTGAIEKIVDRLEALDRNAMATASKLESLDRHLIANREHVAELRRWVEQMRLDEGA